jgi:hypothetical protein
VIIKSQRRNARKPSWNTRQVSEREDSTIRFRNPVPRAAGWSSLRKLDYCALFRRSHFPAVISATASRRWRGPEPLGGYTITRLGSSPADPDRQDFLVIEDGQVIGRIYEERYVPPYVRWRWSITESGARHQDAQ